jgi:hypothetical protein
VVKARLALTLFGLAAAGLLVPACASVWGFADLRGSDAGFADATDDGAQVDAGAGESGSPTRDAGADGATCGSTCGTCGGQGEACCTGNTCASALTCGGGGHAGQCGCTRTCSGKTCGQSDGCGGACTPGVDACESVVLFGGAPPSGQTLFDDTWLWNGASWTQVAMSGPNPGGRSQHAMAGVAGSVVLFGGSDAMGNLLPDTWSWNGTAWQGPLAIGPSARGGHAMAAQGSSVVLFGGFANGNVLPDTWVWNGQAWTSAGSTGPFARWRHAMATLGNQVVLFGGIASTTVYGDTWIWDGTQWSQPTISGPTPPARSEAGMATVTGGVLLYGGQSDLASGFKTLADAWLWNGTTWTCQTNCADASATGPGPRLAVTMAGMGGAALVFGGDDTNQKPLGDTWVSNGATWSEPSVAPSPGPRDQHAMALFQ